MAASEVSGPDARPANAWIDNERGSKEVAEVGVASSEQFQASHETLARKLSARQVQMIAIGGK